MNIYSLPRLDLPLLAFIPINWPIVLCGMKDWSLILWVVIIAGYIVISGVKVTRKSETESDRESRTLQDVFQRALSKRLRS
jgi:L-cystine uptake protein TcyP (sodium:dicarboxylate symporter family)